MNNGTVKWFDSKKGYGFITTSEERDYFIHHSNIIMDGFRSLNEGDVVDFEIGNGTGNREQAVNVKPIITLNMVKDALKEENLYLQTVKNGYGVKKYLVVNADNVLQTSEYGMSLVETAAYAGIDTENVVEDIQNSEELSKIIMNATQKVLNGED